MRYTCLILILSILALVVKSQHIDTLKKGEFITNIPAEKVEHSPKKASTLSAIIPGLGQVYNKKYWKPPILYAGLAALIYATDFNSKNYKDYKDAYKLRMDGDIGTIDKYDIQLVNEELKYSDESLLKLKDYYRRNRDFSIILIGFAYIINIVDAAVDAHFYRFNVNNDLSLELKPNIYYQCLGNQPIPTLGLILKL